jgi:uncharacterized protein
LTYSVHIGYFFIREPARLKNVNRAIPARRWGPLEVGVFGGVSMPISQELLDILVCPKCKGDIQLNPSGDGLVCHACRLMYPVREDIPIMLIDEAIKLE